MRNIGKAMLMTLPFLFVSCKNTTNNAVVQNNDAPRIILEKTKCYRKCPAYTAKFFQSNVVKLYPKENFVVTKKSEGKLKKGRLEELLKEANRINFWQLNDEYDNENLMDAPSTFITVNDKKQSKKIRVRANAPKNLIRFIQQVEKELKTLNWTTIQ